MNSMKGPKDLTMKDETPRVEDILYTTKEEYRAINNSSRKNEEAGPKQK